MAGDSERLGIGQKFAADMRALGFSLRDLPDRLTPYLDFGAETKDRPFRLGQFTLCDFVFASVTCPQLLSDQAIAQLQRLWERCHSLVYRTNEQMTIALDNRWLSLAADHGTEGARAFGMGAILNAPGKMKGQVATRAIDSIQQLLRQDDAVVDLEALDLNPVQRAIPPLEFPSLEPLISGTPSKTVDQLDPDLALELFEQRARLAKALAHPGHYGRVRAAHSKLTPKHPPSRRATDAMSSYLAFVEQRFPELTCQEWIEPVLSENAL